MLRGNPDASAGATTRQLGELLLGAAAARSELSRIALPKLLQRSREELALAGRLLGLKSLSRLRKPELAERVREALRMPAARSDGGQRRAPVARATSRRRGNGTPAKTAGSRKAPPPAREATATPDVRQSAGETGARSKFDLGSRAEKPRVEHIPWTYGRDRVTAMVVDPERLYAYWEVRDDAIEAARLALGPGGTDARLTLRVYDITGRIFDGTNAHFHLDTGVEREDRQWYFDIGRPASTHCVEIGMLSSEGRFQKIARSGRVDFPRAEPAGPGPVEWLSVRSLSEPVAAPVPGAERPAIGVAAGAAHEAPAATRWEGPPGKVEPGETDEILVEGDYWAVEDSASPGEWAILSGWESQDFPRAEWTGGYGRLQWSGGRQRFEWIGPVVGSSWESGPFPISVEAPGLVEERYEGPVIVHKVGDKTRLIYGPWQVVIRGIGARAEGRVLATWAVRKSWVTHVGFEVVDGRLRWEAIGAPGVLRDRHGASEALQPGASERHWLAGSEVRLAGASELFRVGASEARYLGASQALFAGASERSARGASERRWLGASETLVAGASERRLQGASESLRRGASERIFAGASERRARGASEQRLGGASESRFPGASEKTGRKRS